MFKKLLVANRGEIAIRVMRACKEMGIVPVAVYSECDRYALHVSHAYESYPIGPSPSSESYLAGEKIIATAKACRAEGIHPGYGFLAENADFAEACRREGLVFVGPDPEAIRLMGEKLKARRVVSSAGVPVIPGSNGPVSTKEEAAAESARLGYPVIVKASAGGGGKGMRVVAKEEDIPSALEMTKGEATGAFGSDQVYLEKYIAKPRHVEVQLLADRHGNIITLGERECSLQRRYQKVIEEAPSPVVDDKLRDELASAAARVALAAGYVGAGTVEFILDGEGRYYFLEMNTRIQVEHPVTEMVWGVDIVKEQIRIAAGEKTSWRQEDVRMRGHAVEARIYAEDPAHNFVPCAGRVVRLSLPQGPGVRNENGIYEGYEVPVYYDPLLGKIIAWAEDRPSAIKRLRRALCEYQLEGLRTNLDFLLWALHEEGFVSGSYDTGYIERTFEPRFLHRHQEEIDLAVIAASITAYNRTSEQSFRPREQGGDSPWRRAARREAVRRGRW